VTNPFVSALVQAKSDNVPVLLPGAVDALTALLVQRLDFPAVYLTGAGLANARFGVPDIGLTTMTEVIDQVSAIAEVVDIPIVVDGDTGFGNALNVQRTVRLLERAGASAIQLEDQVMPKKCGHFDGKEVIPKQQMVDVIRAALDARRSDTAIIARTDAAATHGLDDALDRMAAYRDAGAEVLFVEAPPTREALARIPAEVDGLHLVNIVEGGKTPMLDRDEAGAMGFSAILYANAAMRGAAWGADRILHSLKENGSTKAVLDEMLSWSDRQALVRKPEFDKLAAQYGTR
jgi:2-methylisocitrate lyase-like PEP mutase family enzyme